MNIISVILARGGSKGIPNKNIIDFCGKPLLAWSIQHCLDAGIKSVYVSTNSNDIARVTNKYGGIPVYRPDELAGDTSTSEAAWEHFLTLSSIPSKPDLVVAPQATSPIREPEDIRKGISLMTAGGYDSIFSASPIEDMCLWGFDKSGTPKSLNYDYKNRARRQDLGHTVIENGSFYIFKPNIFLLNKNRLAGNIGFVEMEFWKMFEIDDMESLRFCRMVMKEYLI